jgi:hypothetical protein
MHGISCPLQVGRGCCLGSQHMQQQPANRNSTAEENDTVQRRGPFAQRGSLGFSYLHLLGDSRAGAGKSSWRGSLASRPRTLRSRQPGPAVRNAASYAAYIAACGMRL